VKRTLLIGLVLLTIARHPIVKADGIGITDATIGFTPIKDSTSGFGRFYLSYNVHGSSNAFVFWISKNDRSGEPFTVKNGAFTFLPGSYDHYVGTHASERLDVYQVICCEDIFSFKRGQYVLALPSTVTPSLNSSYATKGGDEYYLYNVPVLVGSNLPGPGTLELLVVGFGLVVACTVYFHDRRRTRRFEPQLKSSPSEP
jgi:hypothetical protein